MGHGNTLMESFHSSLKREGKDLFLEAKYIWELKRITEERIEYYNQDRSHSALDYKSPINYPRLENSAGGDEILSANWCLN